MNYTVKEIFYTLQGEGANAGRPAVFCRFAGCNLWSGHEKDRATAVCTFCDTDFVGTDGPDGGKFRSAAGFEIAVETNGTLEPPDGIDWICVSPKAGSNTVLLRGDELKLVYPQEAAPPERFADADFEHFYLQPMDGPEITANIARSIEYCLAHPQWRLSLQTHKLLGIP